MGDGEQIAARLRALRIGYVPYSPSLQMPGDRRRFAFYARARNVPFELADPSRDYDLVIISERADISAWMRYRRGPVVYDLIDSYLAESGFSVRRLLRGVGKFVVRQNRHLNLSYASAIRRMCAHAKAVVCSTPEQARVIQPHCANVHAVTDIFAGDILERKTSHAAAAPFRLVWEGLPTNCHTLRVLNPVLRRLDARFGVELRIVTDLRYPTMLGAYGMRDVRKLAPGLACASTFLSWGQESVSRDICSGHVAVIPNIASNPMSVGKPSNKLHFLWMHGMPVVVSSSPAHDRSMRGAGVDGCCDSLEAWERRLTRLLESEEARRAEGEAGLAYVEREWGRDAVLARWDRMFESCLGGGAR